MNYDATERTIRPRLVEHLRELEREATFISEMFVGDFSRRADLIVANGRLAAYEIKSAADDISRLAGQLETYVSLFETVTIVCANNHIKGVLALAPLNVGVWAISPDGEFNSFRNAKVNRTSKASWLSFLPVDVLRKLLREHHHPVAGARAVLLERAMTLKSTELRDFVLRYFKEERQKRIELRRLKSERLANSGLSQFERDSMVRAYAATLAERALTPIPRAKKVSQL